MYVGSFIAGIFLGYDYRDARKERKANEKRRQMAVEESSERIVEVASEEKMRKRMAWVPSWMWAR